MFCISFLYVSFCSCFIFQALNFLCSLSIYRTVTLSYLSGSSWISIFAGPGIGGLLYSLSGDVFLWFFTISVLLCRCVCIWRSRLFQTLWTDFGKWRFSPTSGRDTTMYCRMLALVVKGASCRDTWWPWARGAGTRCLFGSGFWGPHQLCGRWWVLWGILTGCNGHRVLSGTFRSNK